MITALSWASLFSYSTALAILWRYTTEASNHTPSARSRIIMVALIGMIFHAVDLYVRIIDNNGSLYGTELTLGQSISSVAVFATFIFVLLSMIRSTLNLGLAIIPAAILGLLAGRWLNPTPLGSSISHPGFEWHIALSIIAFGLLSLAFAQSILILIQEKQLKTHGTKQSGVSFFSLPALQSMDTLLFQLIWLGFMILSVTLAIGLKVNLDEYGAILAFNHHIVLTLVTWLAYAFLLFGRLLWGWRGRQAAIATIICYSLFLLGYFGTRFVKEVLITSA